MNWIPLNNKTHFSLQRGYSKPEQLVAKCKEFGYKSCAITDINTISGAVAFYKTCKKNEKCHWRSIITIIRNEIG